MEIFYNGQWGTVCDRNWDVNDARVVCRQLGYQYALRALQGSQVDNGAGQIWLNDVACSGSEQNLTSCSHGGWGNHSCGHHEDAGVECSSTGKHFVFYQYCNLYIHFCNLQIEFHMRFIAMKNIL